MDELDKTMLAAIVLFFSGFGIGTVLTAYAIESVGPVKSEAELPMHCTENQRVLMTTAQTAELYVCQTHWVRR